MSTKVIRISSKDRDLESKTNSTTNFVLRFKQDGLPKVSSITLKQLTIQNNFRNVYYVNNAFVFYASSTDPAPISLLDPDNLAPPVLKYTFQVPEGQYDADELCALVKTGIATELSVSESTVVCEVNADGKVDIGVDDFWFGCYSNTTTLDPDGAESNPVAELLGITQILDLSDLTQTASSKPELSGISEVLIQSDFTPSTLITGKGDFLNVLAVCPLALVDYNRSSQIIGTDVIDTIILESPKAIDTMRITITDPYGNLLDNQGGEMTIYALLHF